MRASSYQSLYVIKCCKHYTMHTRALSRCGNVHAHHYRDQKSVMTLSELYLRVSLVRTGVTPPAEPLLPTPLPDLSWQKVATDLFEYDGKHYLFVIDYFSRFIELVELRSETAEHIIVALKSIFARHGIPAVVCSDNGPCYTATSFQHCTTAYSFQHITSSPRFL